MTAKHRFMIDAGILASIVGSLLLLGAPARADDDAADRTAVANLVYCYASGTDAIGDATTNADPLATGISIYKTCIADNAEVRAWFPQQPFDAQKFPNPDAFPSTAPPAFYGPTAWAGFVNSVFRGNGYTFTQHIMTNVDASVYGRHGRVTAYLNATHVRSGSAIGGPSRCVAVANGTYSGEAEKVGDHWMLTKLYLTLITFNPIFQSGQGC